MKPTSNRRAPCLPDALRNFNELPPEASVRVPVVAGLYAVSEVTIWRWAAKGKIPAPQRFGPRVTAWNVGLLREALCAR